MNICILQHVPFEGAGTILPFFESAEHRIKMIHLYAGEPLPSPKWPDFLIVMGGPMGVGDEIEYPWLADEKNFIDQVIRSGAWVLGVCLGAQLIARVLGGSVTKNNTPEIGWFPVQLHAELGEHWLSDILNAEFTALHWHGDTFSIPEGARLLGSSEACANQGFVWQDRVIGLQFHLEFTPESTAILADKCADELIENNPWVQSKQQMLDDREQEFAQANGCMAQILAHVEQALVSKVELDVQLAADCMLLAETAELWLLLNRNASIPWFILVPKGKFREIDDLSDALRSKLFSCADMVSNLLRETFSAEKINVAALGNMVPQLHLHVIGRTSQDACWPNPVWGHLKEHRDWTPDEVESIKERLKSLLLNPQNNP